MGLLAALTGNSSATDGLAHDENLAQILAEGESLQLSFRLLRDYVAFTTRRIIIVNKQGVTGRKREYQSLPYNRVLTFTAETKGTLDHDAEIRVTVQGLAEPVSLHFSDNDSMFAVQRALAAAVCK